MAGKNKRVRSMLNIVNEALQGKKNDANRLRDQLRKKNTETFKDSKKAFREAITTKKTPQEKFTEATKIASILTNDEARYIYLAIQYIIDAINGNKGASVRYNALSQLPDALKKAGGKLFEPKITDININEFIKELQKQPSIITSEIEDIKKRLEVALKNEGKVKLSDTQPNTIVSTMLDTLAYDEPTEKDDVQKDGSSSSTIPTTSQRAPVYGGIQSGRGAISGALDDYNKPVTLSIAQKSAPPSTEKPEIQAFFKTTIENLKKSTPPGNATLSVSSEDDYKVLSKVFSGCTPIQAAIVRMNKDALTNLIEAGYRPTPDEEKKTYEILDTIQNDIETVMGEQKYELVNWQEYLNEKLRLLNSLRVILRSLVFTKGNAKITLGDDNVVVETAHLKNVRFLSAGSFGATYKVRYDGSDESVRKMCTSVKNTTGAQEYWMVIKTSLVENDRNFQDEITAVKAIDNSKEEKNLLNLVRAGTVTIGNEVIPIIVSQLEYLKSEKDNKGNVISRNLEEFLAVKKGSRKDGSQKLDKNQDAFLLGITAEMRKGLGQLHGMGLLHLDNAERNIFMAETTYGTDKSDKTIALAYHVKLADFGQAIRIGDKDPQHRPGFPLTICSQQRIHQETLSVEDDFYAMRVTLFNVIASRLGREDFWDELVNTKDLQQNRAHAVAQWSAAKEDSIKLKELYGVAFKNAKEKNNSEILTLLEHLKDYLITIPKDDDSDEELLNEALANYSIDTLYKIHQSLKNEKKEIGNDLYISLKRLLENMPDIVKKGQSSLSKNFKELNDAVNQKSLTEEDLRKLIENVLKNHIVIIQRQLTTDFNEHKKNQAAGQYQPIAFFKNPVRSQKLQEMLDTLEKKPPQAPSSEDASVNEASNNMILAMEEIIIPTDGQSPSTLNTYASTVLLVDQEKISHLIELLTKADTNVLNAIKTKTGKDQPTLLNDYNALNKLINEELKNRKETLEKQYASNETILKNLLEKNTFDLSIHLQARTLMHHMKIIAGDTIFNGAPLGERSLEAYNLILGLLSDDDKKYREEHNAIRVDFEKQTRIQKTGLLDDFTKVEKEDKLLKVFFGAVEKATKDKELADVLKNELKNPTDVAESYKTLLKANPTFELTPERFIRFAINNPDVRIPMKLVKHFNELGNKKSKKYDLSQLQNAKKDVVKSPAAPAASPTSSAGGAPSEKALVERWAELFKNLLPEKPDVDLPEEYTPTFTGYVYAGGKTGGANKPGEYGGEYVDANDQTKKYMIKLDSQANGKPNAEKVIAEYLAAKVNEQLLTAFDNPWNHEKPIVASIDLIKPKDVLDKDESGHHTYIKSEFISANEGSKDELWKQANPKLASKPTTIFTQNLIESDPAIKKPSEFIRRENLKSDFAKLMAMGIWQGDLGRHGANMLVTEKDGEKHLAAFDFGAAYRDLDHFAPDERLPGGLSKFYKNHFLDYDEDLRHCDEIAIEFIRMSTLTKEQIKKMLQEPIQKLTEEYGDRPLLTFCKQIGISREEMSKTRDIKELILTHLTKKLVERKNKMGDYGLQILLEKKYGIDKISDLLSNNNVKNANLQWNIIFARLSSTQLNNMSNVLETASDWMKHVTPEPSFNIALTEATIRAAELNKTLSQDTLKNALKAVFALTDEIKKAPSKDNAEAKEVAFKRFNILQKELAARIILLEEKIQFNETTDLADIVKKLRKQNYIRNDVIRTIVAMSETINSDTSSQSETKRAVDDLNKILRSTAANKQELEAIEKFITQLETNIPNKPKDIQLNIFEKKSAKDIDLTHFQKLAEHLYQLHTKYHHSNDSQFAERELQKIKKICLDRTKQLDLLMEINPENEKSAQICYDAFKAIADSIDGTSTLAENEVLFFGDDCEESETPFTKDEIENFLAKKHVEQSKNEGTLTTENATKKDVYIKTSKNIERLIYIPVVQEKEMISTAIRQTLQKDIDMFKTICMGQGALKNESISLRALSTGFSKITIPSIAKLNWAANVVENHLAATKDRGKPLYLNGGFSEDDVKALMLYCVTNDVRVVDNTVHRLEIKREEIELYKKQLDLIRLQNSVVKAPTPPSKTKELTENATHAGLEKKIEESLKEVEHKRPRR